MRGFVVLAVIVVMLALFSGCASMCDSSYDCDFHAFGGMRERMDRKNGRVSSIFDPAAARPSVVPSPQTLDNDPMGSDELMGANASQSDDAGESGDSELRDRLLDELDKLDDLPIIPDSGDDAEDSSNDGEI